jgi:ArsR family transcriptional regulator
LLIEGLQCNCELGAALRLAPNLISHHLRILRVAGLVHVERDRRDGRWLFYSVDRGALAALNAAFALALDPGRIKHRRPICGRPRNTLVEA